MMARGGNSFLDRILNTVERVSGAANRISASAVETGRNIAALDDLDAVDNATPDSPVSGIRDMEFRGRPARGGALDGVPVKALAIGASAVLGGILLVKLID